MFQYLLYIGALAQLSGALIYSKDTIRGKTKPNRVTWFLWMLAPYVATAGALADGVTWAVLPVVMSGFGPTLVFFSSFLNKKSYWELKRFDYICGSISIIALILWALTSRPIIAIIFAIIADGLAAFPTIKKSWSFPETESQSIYIAAIFSSFMSFFVMKSWSISEFAFPLYLILVCSTILFSINRKKLFKAFRLNKG